MAKDFRDGLESAYVRHKRVVADVGGPSMTRQEFSEECDINALMARYEKVGIWPMGPNTAAEPQYLDVTDAPGDLREAMDMMMEAEAAFMRLPAVVRREFDNSPLMFVEFASDEANVDKMREWGLAPPLPEKAKPIEVQVVNQPASSDAAGVKS